MESFTRRIRLIKASIIGCGKIAGGSYEFNKTTHAGAYQANKHISLVSCYDTNSSRSKKISKRFNCKQRKTIEAILSDEPDIISICTPENTHFKIVKKILNLSKKKLIIFLEKPSFPDKKNFDEILKILKSSKSEIIVNHSRRFDAVHNNLKKLIKNGKFGKFISASVLYYGGWMHNGVHAIDTLIYLLNKEIKISRIFSRKKTNYKNDPSIDLVLNAGSKLQKIYMNSVEEKNYQIFEFDLRFAKSRVRIEDFGNRIFIENKKTNILKENILIPNRSKLKETKQSSMENAINMIVKHIKSKNKKHLNGFTLEDSYKTMKVMWSAKKIVN